MASKLAVVGDIHGHHLKLVSVLDRLEHRYGLANLRLVFVGDYIDRGPASADVVDTVLALSGQGLDLVCLRGNHEQMMLDARVRQDPAWKDRPTQNSGEVWFSGGGPATIASYQDRMPQPIQGRWWDWVPESHWEFYLSTVFQFDAGDLTVVHAGLLPDGKTLEIGLADADPRLWVRDEFIHDDCDFGRTVVFGHTPIGKRPLIMPNKIGIDTGAAYGGPLTAIVLEERGPYGRNNIDVIQSD